MTLLIVFLFSFSFTDEKKVNKNKYKNKKEISFNNDEDTDEYIKMFVNALNKLKIHYVDSVNESESIKSGIKGLMKNLDPYTKLLEGSSKESYDVLRKGKYGGVGMQLGLRRDTLTVLAPLEDSPAYSEGIYSGDQILMIDSTSTLGMTTKEAAEIIKGDLGTMVTLRILRPSSKKMINFDLERSNIRVKHVPYWGIDKDNIGYIRLTKFSKNAAKDFRLALEELNKNKVDGLIIDLRGNSGGLLNNAINILDYLCDRGETLLKSKGKAKRANKEWISRRKPVLDIDIPIAVLINRSSASASEIVSGALQDLDRAVIIGQKSFGKGLVQHMFDLNDTTTLKLTTAKYYLPSGRLIQKEDYLDNGFLTDGLDVKDSLFTTKGGRVVKGGGGIYPDIKTDIQKKSPYINELWREGVFLSFAATYVPINNIAIENLSISKKVLSDFKKFLNEYELEYYLEGEREFEKIKQKISKSAFSINKFSKNISKESSSNFFNDIEEYYSQLKLIQYSLPENQKWIKNGLLREMSRVASGEKERIKVSLLEDYDYSKAVSVLKNLKEYYTILEF